MKDWDDYRSRSECGFRRPIEFNWRGDRIDTAKVGTSHIYRTFGPNSPARCVVTVVEVDENAETITLECGDGSGSFVETFEEFAKYRGDFIDAEFYFGHYWHEHGDIQTEADVADFEKRRAIFREIALV